MLFARQAVVTEAKAFGLDAIDLVDIDYKGMCWPPPWSGDEATVCTGLAWGRGYGMCRPGLGMRLGNIQAWPGDEARVYTGPVWG